MKFLRGYSGPRICCPCIIYTKSEGLSPSRGCNLLLHSRSRKFLGRETAIIGGFEIYFPRVLFVELLNLTTVLWSDHLEVIAP